MGKTPSGLRVVPQPSAARRETPRWNVGSGGGTDVAVSLQGRERAPAEKSMRLLDPFAVFVVTGLSIGVVAGVVVGWGTVCLLGSLRWSDLSWPSWPKANRKWRTVRP